MAFDPLRIEILWMIQTMEVKNVGKTIPKVSTQSYRIVLAKSQKWLKSTIYEFQ